MSTQENLCGVILAGGKASRMHHQDKALLTLGGKPIIESVLKKATAQVQTLVLSVNHNPHKYHYLNRDIIADFTTEVSGPLVGIVSAMKYFSTDVSGDTQPSLMACFAADVPWFPDSLIPTLEGQLQATQADVALASHNDFLQPLFSLWNLSLLPQLEAAVCNGMFGPKQILGDLNATIVDFSDDDARTFLNINTPQDLELAQNLYKITK